MGKPKYWYIVQRCNPQLSTYFIGLGRVRKSIAESYQKPLYGSNTLILYTSEEAYQKGLKEHNVDLAYDKAKGNK